MGRKVEMDKALEMKTNKKACDGVDFNEMSHT